MKRKIHRSVNIMPKTADTAAIAQIQKLRPGLSGSCPISFYLYFSSKDDAAKSASELKKMDFGVKVTPSIGVNNWLCLATKEMVPEKSKLTNLRSDMIDIAFKYGGTYDGWEAEIKGSPDVLPE